MSAPRSPAATLLLPRYLEHRARDVAALRHALDVEDFPSVGRIGHNLRGNGRSYGFPELAAIGEGLEAAARAKNAARIREQLESLDAWLRANRGATTVAGASCSRPASETRVRAVTDPATAADPDDEDD
jgi:HPt (histidine-containing phosphotransfer) domain-containing protein